jgi:hypothetical protein
VMNTSIAHTCMTDRFVPAGLYCVCFCLCRVNYNVFCD